MKSFYQFYESVSSSYIDKVYSVSSGFEAQQHPIKIERIYELELDAEKIAKAKGAFKLHHTLLGNSVPKNGDVIYLIMGKYPNGLYDLENGVSNDKNEVIKAIARYAKIDSRPVKYTILQTTFVTKGNVNSKPTSIPSTPKSPYANLKYPLIGELTHYLSTQNLNQEIYHVMRDKNQKSINLLNNLRTLIKKIELA